MLYDCLTTATMLATMLHKFLPNPILNQNKMKQLKLWEYTLHQSSKYRATTFDDHTTQYKTWQQKKHPMSSKTVQSNLLFDCEYQNWKIWLGWMANVPLPNSMQICPTKMSEINNYDTVQPMFKMITFNTKLERGNTKGWWSRRGNKAELRKSWLCVNACCVHNFMCAICVCVKTSV